MQNPRINTEQGLSLSAWRVGGSFFFPPTTNQPRASIRGWTMSPTFSYNGGKLSGFPSWTWMNFHNSRNHINHRANISSWHALQRQKLKQLYSQNKGTFLHFCAVYFVYSSSSPPLNSARSSVRISVSKKCIFLFFHFSIYCESPTEM